MGCSASRSKDDSEHVDVAWKASSYEIKESTGELASTAEVTERSGSSMRKMLNFFFAEPVVAPGVSSRRDTPVWRPKLSSRRDESSRRGTRA